MSQFVTVVSLHPRNPDEVIIQHTNERAIHCVHFNKDVEKLEYDVVCVVLIDEGAPLEDRLYNRYIKHRMDARHLLVHQMGFNVGLFDTLVFQFEGSVINKDEKQ